MNEIGHINRLSVVIQDTARDKGWEPVESGGNRL